MAKSISCLKIFCLGFVLILTDNVYGNETILNQNKFKDDFIFGAATSAYQIEGAWNENGKGISISDDYTHRYPDKIADRLNGDVAADSYHKYKEDVQLLKKLGVNFYRFSLSWSRILPTGYINKINMDGIQYYTNLINELKKAGITPMVTITHFDIPQPLQHLGGWANPLLVDYYLDYARLVFDRFGQHVQYWITINAPYAYCQWGNQQRMFGALGVADYMCVHHMLIAHARAYRLFKNEYQGQGKALANAKVSISLDVVWYEPKSNKKEDKEAAKVQLEFHLGTSANPIFGTGDYPSMVKDLVNKRSLEEGYPKSRLPEFTPEEIAAISGSADFFALNFYTRAFVEHTVYPIYTNSSQEMDAQVTISSSAEVLSNPMHEKSSNYFRKIINYVKQNYNNPIVIVTENGFRDKGELNDCPRAQYIQEYLSALLDAIYVDGCNVTGYAVWSLLDNFDWTYGFSRRFGLYYVDITTAERKRTAKKSAREYSRIIKARKLPEKTIDVAICGTERSFVKPTLISTTMRLSQTWKNHLQDYHFF